MRLVCELGRCVISTFVEVFVFRSRDEPERLEFATLAIFTPHRNNACEASVTERFVTTTSAAFQMSKPPR